MLFVLTTQLVIVNGAPGNRLLQLMCAYQLYQMESRRGAAYYERGSVELVLKEDLSSFREECELEKLREND